MSFAVIKTGGKQYKVAEGDKFLVEKLEHEVGQEFDFEEVLLVVPTPTSRSRGSSISKSESKDSEEIGRNEKIENLKVGQPMIAGAKVHARVLEQGKGKKKIVFKFASKTRYKKKKGHRQPFTKVEILKISA